MSEKSITRQQVGGSSDGKNKPSEPRDLAGACSG